jgi:O-antigen/teichoic acid export membrane protein
MLTAAKLSIARNTGAYMVASVAPMAVNFLMLPVYTRYMTPADYGVLALVSVFSALLLSMSGLQVASSLGRHFFDHDYENQRVLFSSLLFSIVGINLCMLLPLHVFGEHVSKWAFRGGIPFHPYLQLALILVFFNGITSCCVFMLRTEQRGGAFMLLSLGNTLTSVLFGIYFVVIRGMGAHGALLGTTCSASVYACTLLLANRRSLRFVYDPAKVKIALRFSIPLVPVTMGSILFIYSDKYVLSYFVSTAAIGLYDMANRFAVLIQMGGTSYKGAYSPVFMRLAIENREHAPTVFKHVITRYVVVCCLAILGVAMFAEDAIQLLLPEAFHGSYRFIPILLGAYFFQGMMTFPLCALRFVERTKVLPVGTLVPGILNIVVNIVLIPRYGIIVAAWTTLGAYLLNFMILLMFSNRYYRLVFEWQKITSVCLLAIGLFVTVRICMTDGLGLNLLIKTAAVSVYVVAMAITDCGSVFSDAVLGVQHLVARGRGQASS